MKNFITAAAFAIVIALAADPAMAQWATSGSNPFRSGFNTVLGWVYVFGVLVCLVFFVVAAIGAMRRNPEAFFTGVIGCIVGGVLLAQAPTIVTQLTGLQAVI